jgi:hypothetical protein
MIGIGSRKDYEKIILGPKIGINIGYYCEFTWTYGLTQVPV